MESNQFNGSKYTYYKAFGKIPEWDIVECMEETSEQITIAVALSEETAKAIVELLNYDSSLLQKVSREQLQ